MFLTSKNKFPASTIILHLCTETQTQKRFSLFGFWFFVMIFLILLLATIANVTIGGPQPLHDPATEATEVESRAESVCRRSSWNCVSQAVEKSLHYLDNHEGITR